MGVLRKDPNGFNAAVTSETDNSDRDWHENDYLCSGLYKYTRMGARANFPDSSINLRII
jgi:hypothetical protein